MKREFLNIASIALVVCAVAETGASLGLNLRRTQQKSQTAALFAQGAEASALAQEAIEEVEKREKVLGEAQKRLQAAQNRKAKADERLNNARSAYTELTAKIADAQAELNASQQIQREESSKLQNATEAYNQAQRAFNAASAEAQRLTIVAGQAEARLRSLEHNNKTRGRNIKEGLGLDGVVTKIEDDIKVENS